MMYYAIIRLIVISCMDFLKTKKKCFHVIQEKKRRKKHIGGVLNMSIKLNMFLTIIVFNLV